MMLITVQRCQLVCIILKWSHLKIFGEWNKPITNKIPINDKVLILIHIICLIKYTPMNRTYNL